MADQIIDLNLHNAGEIETIKNKSVFAFAGIAHPENFKDMLVKQGMILIGFQSYADHYDFSIADLEDLIHRCKEKKCQILICTEKDLIKITQLKDVEKRLKNTEIQLFGFRLKLEIKQPEKLFKNILTILDKNR